MKYHAIIKITLKFSTMKHNEDGLMGRVLHNAHRDVITFAGISQHLNEISIRRKVLQRSD